MLWDLEVIEDQPFIRPVRLLKPVGDCVNHKGRVRLHEALVLEGLWARIFGNFLFFVVKEQLFRKDEFADQLPRLELFPKVLLEKVV